MISRASLEVVEQVPVEALVLQAAVEARTKPFLHRFARCDVVPFDAALSLPSQDRIRSQLGAVVTDDHARMAPETSPPAATP
jgi:hypothetical protein